MQGYVEGLLLSVRDAAYHHWHRLLDPTVLQGRPDLRLALHIHPVDFNQLVFKRQRVILEQAPGRLGAVLPYAVEYHGLLDEGPQEGRPQP